MHRPSGFQLRVEPLEQRTLLSAAPFDALQRDLPDAAPPPNWDIVICDDDGTLFGIDPDDMSPIFLNQGPRYEDIAYCPWEDVSFWGFYGVAWSPSAQTSFLYHFEVYTSGQTTVQTGPGRAIRTSDGSNVRLGALEFSDRGTLYSAGYRLGSNLDETFTIDLNTAVATHHQNLPAGYYSAGDIHFHRPDGSMYLTTQQAKLLKMSQPWSSPTPAFQIKPGDLLFGDFDGVGLDAPYLALGFRRAKGSTGQYGVYPIDLGSGSVNEGNVDWLGDVASLDNVRGAATRYSTAKADLSGAYFDVTPAHSAGDGTSPADGTASAGTGVNVAFEVQNTGAKNAGPFDVAFYLSTDPNIGTGDKYLGTWSSDGVGALSTTSRLTESLSLPALGDPFFNGTGTYYLGMIVDSSGQVVESNENDNSNTGQGLDYDAVQIVVATLSIDDVTVSPEGDSGTRDAVFTVQLSHATSLEVTVDYATADGTAAAGTDYDGRSGTLTFPPNQTQQTIRVPVRGDTLDEIDEGFFVNLSNAAHAVIDDGQGAGTIIDDDPPPTVSIDDVTVTEQNSGTTEAVFTVTLSGASGKVVEVDYATADGTALDGKDYEATGGPPPLRFEPGQTQQEIRVPVQGDALDEIDEDFFVNLSGAAVPSSATAKAKRRSSTTTCRRPFPSAMHPSTRKVMRDRPMRSSPSIFRSPAAER